MIASRRREGADAVAKTRNTDRKRIIQAVLADTAGTPIVLEELRWRVIVSYLLPRVRVHTAGLTQVLRELASTR